MSGESTRSHLVLSACQSHQLATLIANMVESQLRASASTQHPPSLELESSHDRQDHTSSFAISRGFWPVHFLGVAG